MAVASFSGGVFSEYSPIFYFPDMKKLAILFLCLQLWVTPEKFSVSANFNLFLDRREFQKLHGISSDIYYVREGVVNQYALNFVVTVPPEVDDLHFTWQALTKRTIHYEMVMEYADLLALSPPQSNITSTGRVPHNLQTFKVSLLCTGKSNAEVGVTIRMNFQVKHPKPNTTSITIKRNKICLFSEKSSKSEIPTVFPETGGRLPGQFPPDTRETSLSLNPKADHGYGSSNLPIPRHDVNSNALLFQGTTPSLLLAGLLGGCVFTASLVFLTFFICVRRKLACPIVVGSSSPNAPPLTYGNDPNSSTSNNSSPACLLRQNSGNSPGPENDNQKIWNHFNPSAATAAEKGATISSSHSGSHNSYVTIASFWNDIFSPGTTVAATASNSQFRRNSEDKFLQNSLPGNSTRGGMAVADVSPYAYAHIIPKIGLGNPPPPPLIDWSQKNYSFDKNPTNQHIYSNTAPMCSSSFGGPNSNFCPKIVSGGPMDRDVNYSTSTMRSDCDSLVQIDGFQCRKDFGRSSVVERFL